MPLGKVAMLPSWKGSWCRNSVSRLELTVHVLFCTDEPKQHLREKLLLPPVWT